MTCALLFLLGLLLGIILERVWTTAWDAVELYREERRREGDE